MANEQSRAETSISRGKQAARMLKAGVSNKKVQSYIADQGNREAADRRTNATIGKAAGYDSDPISMKTGGKVHKTGIYKLHKGETVMIPEQFRKHKLGHRN